MKVQTLTLQKATMCISPDPKQVYNWMQWCAYNHSMTIKTFKTVQSHTSHMNKSVPSVLWRCWMSGGKGIWPVKTEWLGTGMVISLEQGANKWFAYGPADATVSISIIQHGLPCWYRLMQVVLEKRPLNGCSVVVVHERIINSYNIHAKCMVQHHGHDNSVAVQTV